MNKKDERTLKAIRYNIQHDAKDQEDINRAIESRKRAFFVEVVGRVMNQLKFTAPDESFITTAYEWFKEWNIQCFSQWISA